MQHAVVGIVSIALYFRRGKTNACIGIQIILSAKWQLYQYLLTKFGYLIWCYIIGNYRLFFTLAFDINCICEEQNIWFICLFVCLFFFGGGVGGAWTPISNSFVWLYLDYGFTAITDSVITAWCFCERQVTLDKNLMLSILNLSRGGNTKCILKHSVHVSRY